MKKVLLIPFVFVQIAVFAQPTVPTALTISTLSTSGILLGWTDASSNETGFQIERSLTPGSGFALVATTAANATSYINTGLTAGRQYFFRIRSTNAGGSSAYSSVVTATTGLRRFLIDFGASNVQTTTAGWNNITLPTTGSVTNLVESTGAGSSISLQIVKDPSNGYGASNTGGSNLTVLDYPISAGSDSHYGWQAGGTYRLNGLDNSKVYNLRVFSSRMSISDSRKGAFTINGQQQLLESANNTTQTIVFSSIVPIAGSITMDFNVAAGSSFAYINVLDIVEGSVTPQAPNSLAAIAFSSTQVNLTWADASGNETGFQIERSLTAGSGFSLITTTAANTVAYSDGGLSPATQYFYRVKAINAEGSSAYTTETSITTLADPPTPPTTLVAAVQSAVQINLTWTDNSSNETGFQIERSLTSGTGFTLIATTAPNISSYANVGLAAGKQYFYRVRAVNPGGNSTYTTEATATTLNVPPLAPSVLVAVASSATQINLTWSDGSSNESAFEIERSLISGSGFVPIGTTGTNITTLSDAGLTESTLYYYRVKAINDAGSSLLSAEASATTLAVPPIAPTTLIAIAESPSRVDLSWVDSSENESGFQVERSLTTGSGFTIVTTTLANVTSFSDASLTADTHYFFRVKAVNTGGSSAFSPEADVTTLTAPPIAPTSLTAAAASSSQINISWADASGNETGFQIERSLTTGTDFTLIASTEANVTSYSDAALIESTLYIYRVRAINAAGSSAYTVEVNSTTLASPPLAPTTLTAIAQSSGQVNLTWIDDSGNETGFQIERSLTTGTAFILVATTSANATGFSDTGLTPNKQYFYRVRAGNSGGHSAYSAEAIATTFDVPPTAPAGLTALTASYSTINLAWTDASTNEAGFQIERSLIDGSEFIPITTTAANTTSFSDTNLAPATNYFYRLKAVNAMGSSTYAAEANAITLPTPPVAPITLSAVGISSAQISLTWIDASDNETSFQIERSLTTGVGFSIVATLPSNTTTFSDAGLTPNTQYFYKVKAINSGGPSAFTPEAIATTLSAPPSAPVSLTAIAATSSRINLAWTDTSGDETGFQIERSTTPGAGFTLISTTVANANTFADAGVTENTRYYYRVRAINIVGNSAYTAEATTITPALTQPYGQIFNETDFSSTTRFPIAGTGISRGANKLVMAGNPTLFSSYIYHDDASNPFRYTCLENWKVRARVKTPALNASSYGIGIGVQSVNTVDPYSTIMRWSWDAGANFIYLYYKSTISLQMVSTTKYVPAANTYYWVEVTRTKDSFTYTIFDGTNGTTQLFTAKLTFPTFTASNYVKSHNTGQFAIHQFGGANELTNWEVSTSALKNADYAGVGDSNMHGMFATNNSQRWVENAMTNAGKSFNIMAGISDRTTDIIKRLPEVIALNPKAVVLSVGRNDLANSVPLATVQTNINTIISTLEAAGITVKLAGVIASNINVSTLQTFLNGKSNQQVNGYTATKAASGTTLNTSYSSGDNIHMNQAGNTVMSNLLLTILVPQTPPAAPSVLTASSASPSQINLTWTDNSNNETGFQIERSLASGSGFTLLTTTAANTTSYSNTGLASGTQYYYRIRATNPGGNSGYSSEASASTQILTAPATPTTLTAVAASSAQINLTWADASNNETGFQIERSLTTTSGFALITTTAQNITSYSDAGRTPSTKYFYRVRAVNDVGSSTYSAEANATTTSTTVNPGGRRFLIDFGSPTVQTVVTGWNNVTTPLTGTNVALVESTGTASSASFLIVKDPSNGYGAFSTGGNNQVVLDYPATAASDGHYAWQSGGTYRLNGLDNSKTYSLRMYGSRMSVGDPRQGSFTINGQQQFLEAANNTSVTIVFANIVPTAGSITIDFNVAAGSTFAYLNVLDISESALGARTVSTNSDSGAELSDKLIKIESRIDVYPNPAATVVNIKVNDPVQQKATIQIIDLLGKEIQNRETNTNENNMFDVRSLTVGLYVVRVQLGGKYYSKSFLKKD